MPAKLSYEYVKDSCEKRGYSVLTSVENYVNASTKINLRCPQGHIWGMAFAIFNFGHGCPVCAGNRKFTIEYVREIFADAGYVLLTEHYVNTFQKLNCLCPKGHEWSVQFYSFKNNGRRCRYCSSNSPITFDKVKSSFEDEGCILLSEKYVHSKAKLEYICSSGHRATTTWSDWNQGKRCRVCQYINLSGPNSSNWRGGVQYEPYCQDWTKDLKEYIKYRDGYMCLNSDCTKKSDKLCVHHIDYSKKTCGPENLITLCNSCNCRANFSREWHTAWYQAILSRRYGYRYEDPVAQRQSGEL